MWAEFDWLRNIWMRNIRPTTILDKKHVDAIKNGWSLGQSIIQTCVHSYSPLSCHNVVATCIAIFAMIIQVYINIVSEGRGSTLWRICDIFFKSVVFYMFVSDNLSMIVAWVITHMQSSKIFSKCCQNPVIIGILPRTWSIPDSDISAN